MGDSLHDPHVAAIAVQAPECHELVENDAERHAVSKKLKETNLESLFFNTEVSNDFCTAVRWIYEHHEKIKDDGRKCWSIADRELLG